jgi:tetratricopeptide (TPR) repeat protein/predicted Ser/Thr protein kinase
MDRTGPRPPPVDDWLGTGGALAGALWSELGAELLAEAPVAAGETVARYRVLREVGRGGMSVVYLAERADGNLRQLVALKLLHLGADDEARRRFEQEREILAGLNHPHIARLVDGGIDQAGRAFIALEFVDGQPIDRWADQRRLTVDERLALFADVVEAVGYAHRNLIVHRDIKPSNVLVDGEGHVRLVDFGIAKLLDPARSGALTRTQAQMMTPEYASPEQFLGGPLTTASDVYQLGLLLFELLTGRRARSGEGQVTAGRDVADAPRASRVVARGPADDPRGRAAAAARRTTPQALARRLRGDLDTIVAACLHREPERRYASTDALQADLARSRAGLPVAAHANTWPYRVGKFARRHRLAAGAAALVLVLLAGYAVTVTLHSRRIAREAARTERVKNLLLGLFDASDPRNSGGADPPASELLRRGAARAALELVGEPELQAETQARIGIVLGTLGRYGESADVLATALATRRRVLGARHPGTLDTARWLARNLHFMGRYAEAEPLYREVLAGRRELFAADALEVTESLMNLGCLLHGRGDLRAAEPLLREALRLREGRHGPRSPEAAVARNNLGDLLLDARRRAEAEPQLRQAVEVLHAAYGPIDPQVAVARDSLGLLLAEKGAWAEADPLLTANLAHRRRLYPGGHATLPASLRSLALLRARQGRLDEARELADEALAMYAQQGARHPFVARAETTRAEIDARSGRASEAARRTRATLAWLQEAGFAAHPFAAPAYEILAQALAAQGRTDEASRALAQARELLAAAGAGP